MATNPARPAYQDVIDEAWGDQVADHVIRRYPDAAARDLDLSGVAAVDLQGQVVVLVPAGGIPHFEYYDQAAAKWLPIPSGFDMQAGSFYGPTDVNANVSIPFPRPFAPTAFVILVAMLSGESAIAGGCTINSATPTNFSIRCTDPAGVPTISQNVSVRYVAAAGIPPVGAMLESLSDESRAGLEL
jgi:hypothetical protein